MTNDQLTAAEITALLERLIALNEQMQYAAESRDAIVAELDDAGIIFTVEAGVAAWQRQLPSPLSDET